MENTYALNCVIVDDEPLAIEGLRRQLKSLGFLNLAASFHDAVEASSYLESNKVDLLFLDVNMPQLSGTGMLGMLSNKPLTIFTTAHPDHALEAFRLDAVDYLLKPFTFEKLLKAINKAVFMIKAKSMSNADEHTFIRSDGSYHRLNFKDIVYVEGMKDYVKVHSAGDVLTVALNLSSIMEKLPKDTFIRVHKSYIVNKKKISRFDSFEITLDSVTIPIGNSYREIVQDQVLKDRLIRK